MRSESQVKLLGWYLLACSIYQFCLYARPDGVGSILDPRVGLFFLPFGEAKDSRLVWVSAVWIAAVAAGFLFGGGKLPLLLYLVSELFLAAPTVLYLVAGISGGAGHLTLAGGSMLVGIGVFVLFTVIPVALSVAVAVQWVKASGKS